MGRKSAKPASYGGAPADASERKLIDLLSPSVRKRSQTRRFAAGQPIVSEGEAGPSAFILLSGFCEVSVHGEVISHVSQGEVFGEIACLENGTRTASVRAARDSEILEIAADDLRAELRRSPILLDRFLRITMHRVRDISLRETSARDEHRELRRVLQGLQPSLDKFERHPRLSVEVRWEPLTFASGDYYDVIELSPTRFLFALGDVLGHGAPTAPIVSMVRSQLHEFATLESRPGKLLEHLHQHVLRHGHPTAFMTLTLLILDVESMNVHFSSAGPPCPLIYRGGRCSPLTTRFGWTLGYPFHDIPFDDQVLPVEPGDVLLFYTDGLSDASRGAEPDVDRLGSDRLAEMFQDLCVTCGTGSVNDLFTRVEDYRNGRLPEDDATALVVRLK